MSLLLIATSIAVGGTQAAATVGTIGNGPRRVCVDPGHGGSDPGAVYAGMNEKDLTLHVATALANALATEATVTLTRTDDTALGNSERAAICNKAKAEVVLSIHLNASTNHTVDYAQVFYGKLIKDLAFAQSINSNYEITNPDGTCCLRHASVTNFANGTLLKSTAPAALVETVFLSNDAEQQLLRAGTREQEIASALYRGVHAWLAAH